jgi:uncharacterized OB-fold protein
LERKTLKLELRWKRNYEEKEIIEEGRRRKCGNIFVTSRECACSRADQEINEEARRRKCGNIFVTSLANSRADQEINERRRRRMCGDIFVTSRAP